MDMIFEVKTSYLLEILNERLSRERFVFPILLPHNDDAWVFHHARLAGLEWLPSSSSRETIRVAGPDAAGERPVRWLDVPQLRMRAVVALRFAQLSGLRRLAPGDVPGTERFDVSVELQVRVDRQARLVVSVLDVGLEPLRPWLIDQLRAGRVLDPSEEREIARQATERLEELRGRIFEQLRRTSAGSLTVAIDLRALGQMFGGAPPAPYNTGIALLQLAADGSEAHHDRVLAIAIQLESGRWSLIRDRLEADRASSAIWSWWNDFYRNRRPSVTATERWALFVAGELLAEGMKARLSGMLGEGPEATLRRRGPVTATWRPPQFPEFPNGSLRAGVAVNVTNFDVEADVRALTRIQRSGDREILTVTRLEWDLNEAQVARWASLAGLAASGIGAVIGGAAGGIGAPVGFLVGFVTGFTAAEVAAHAYTPSLPLPPECGQRDREVSCRVAFPSALGELVSGLRVLRVSGSGVGIFIAGTAVASTARPARPSLVLGRSFRWQRTGSLFSREWSAVLELVLSNLGEKPLLAGPAMAHGAGAGLYANRVAVPMGPISGGGTVRLRLVVPRAELEAERAAGRLHPPQLVIFTNAGARVLETTELPAPVTDEQIDRVDSIEAIIGEVRRLERAGRVLDQVFPEPPGGYGKARVHTLLQVAARRGDPAQQLVLADLDSKNVLAASRIAGNGEVGLTALVSGTEKRVGLLALPAELALEKLQDAVAESLLAAGDGESVRKAFAEAFGEALVPPSAQPAGREPIASLDWFDLRLDRVRPGMAEAALEKIRAHGYGDSGLDLVALRTTLLDGASLYLANPSKLEPVVDATGRQLLSVSTPAGRLRFDVDGLSHPVLTDVDGEPGEVEPLVFGSALEGLVPVGRSLVARDGVTGDGEKAAERLLVMTVADRWSATSLVERAQKPVELCS